MPDAAVGATQAQFRRLVTAAAPDAPPQVELFAFDEIVRSKAMQTRMAPHYRSADGLAQSGVDALIVTGAEPLAAKLSDEAFWNSFRRMTDWAVASQTPVLWSCMAAHAAVLHLDGIERRRLSGKCSGVFECRKADAHPLTAAMPDTWPTPHSRLNTLDETALRGAGYAILSVAPDAGVDAFTGGRGGAGSVFLQGHPEYDANSLAAEYQRDVLRYAQGLIQRPPSPPSGYFAPEIVQALEAITAQQPAPDVLKSRVLEVVREARPQAVWRSAWDHFYTWWLSDIRGRANP